MRRQIRRAYGLISTGQLDALVAQFAPNEVFSFPGEQCSEASSAGPMPCVHGSRVRRLVPGKSGPRRIVVEGGPFAHACGDLVRRLRDVPGRVAVSQRGAQLIELQRGRVVEDRLFEDTK